MRKEKGEREREKTWVFPARTIDELKSVERGRAGADTPMLIQDFDVSMSIAIQDDNPKYQFGTMKGAFASR